MRHRIIKGKWSGTYKFRSEPDYYSWISSEIYSAAGRVLGLPGLSKKQVSELIDRKAAATPIDIQGGLEPVTDETSHVPLGSSPETPILLLIPGSNGMDQTSADDRGLAPVASLPQ